MQRRSILTLAGIAVAAAAAAVVFSVQAQPARKSPHETAEFVLGGKKITIT